MMSENPAIGESEAFVEVEATANAQAAFAFNFPIYDKEQLEVWINDNAPLNDAHYTVDQVENADGGTLTLIASVADDILDGDVVTIRRMTPIERSSKYSQTSLFRSYTVNRDFDLLIMICQELRREDGDLSDAIAAEAVARDLADDRLESIINAMIEFETGDNTLGGLTRNAIPSIEIDDAITYLRTIGVSAPDEGPADNAVAVDDVPAHGNYVDDLNGRHFAFNSRTQTLYTVGAASAAAVAAIIKAKLDELQEKGGGELIVKDEHVSAGVSKLDYDTDLVLNFDSGRQGAMTLNAGATIPLLKLFPAVGYTGKLTVLAPRLDCSEGQATAGASTSSGMALGPWEHIHVERGIIGAGDDPTADKGDSGISTLGALWTRIESCFFKGWSDAAIYPSGGGDGSTADDGELVEVVNCSFERSTWCVTAKRQLGHLVVLGGHALECEAGIGTFQTTADLLPTRQVDIVGFTGRKFASRILELNGISKAKIVGLRLTDFGYDPLDPDTIVGANPTAIILDGVSGITIEALLIEMRDWDGADAHVGVNISNQTAFAVVYTGGNHFIQGAMTGLFRAISEGAGVDPSRFDLRLNDYDQIHGASQPAASVYEISTDGAKKTLEVGSTTYVQTTEQEYHKTTGTLLSSLGTLAATTTSATVTVPLVGAAAGDIVQFMPTSAGAAANPQLSYVARAITDAVEVVARNNSGSGFDFTAQTFICTATRRPNA